MSTSLNIHGMDSVKLSYHKHYNQDGSLWYTTLEIEGVAANGLTEHRIVLFGNNGKIIPFVWNDTEVYVNTDLVRTEPAPISLLSEAVS